MTRGAAAAARLPLLACGLALALSGCNALTRVQNIGEAPAMTTIQDPVRQPGYQPISMPMPASYGAPRQANSIWQAGTRAFFKDQRAGQVGDILTVLIDIKEKATFDNTTTRTRDNTEGATIPHLGGLERNIQRLLPNQSDPANLVDLTAKSQSKGTGNTARNEELRLTVAALVTQVLPNGNLVVQGKQELRVNYELRELQVAGVIRPQDISSTNTIPLEKIAEARLSYGGRGQLIDVQQPRYGQQVLDVILPF